MARTAWKTKGLLFVAFAAVYAVFYILPNLRPLFPPMYLPMLPVDYVFSLVPWTFVLYLSDYVYIFCAIAMLHDEAFHSFGRQMFMALFICGLCFLFFPTTYPRPVYPTDVTNPLVRLAMFLVGTADTPHNCFPSMHVALTAVSYWAIRHKGPRLVVPFGFWAVGIFLSTLTTKQHYFADIVAGVTVAATVALLDRVLAETRLFKRIVMAKSSKRLY